MSHHRPTPSTLAIAAVMAFFALITWRWSWNQGPPIIRSDAEGYYGYLRAVFINHDLGNERLNSTYLHGTPDGTLNKYFAWEAVMLTPFFLAAHGWAHLSGDVPDGLSTPYLRAIGLAGLVYALLGLLAIRAFLRRSGIAEAAIAAVLLVIGFGTQLVQYASIQPGWSHVYSFCAVSVFLLVTERLSRSMSIRRCVFWGLSLGLVVLLRPVNGLVVLALPVALGTGAWPFLRTFFGRRWAVTAAAIAFGGVVLIQSALWYAQVGHFIAYGYKGEGFHWDRPALFQVLIGFRRGLFLWTPVLLFAVLGAIVLLRRDRVRAVASLVYWVVNTYIIASWWIWYYGSGWGARVYIDHYPVLFVPLAHMLSYWHGTHRRMWRATTIGLAATCLFTMAQFYQYNHNLLDVEGMDARKYAYAFLRFDDAHRDRLGGMYRVPPYHPDGLDTLMHEKWDAEGSWTHWDARRIRMSGAPSATHAVACDLVDAFGPSFTLEAHEFPAGRELYLAIGFERYVEHVDDTRDVLCVAVTEDSAGTQSFYSSFRMEPLPPSGEHVWEHLEYRVPYPATHGTEDLKFYFWNQKSNGRFRLDDLDVTVMAVREY